MAIELTLENYYQWVELVVRLWLRDGVALQLAGMCVRMCVWQRERARAWGGGGVVLRNIIVLK